MESSQCVEHKNRMSRISELIFYTCLVNWIDWFIEKIRKCTHPHTIEDIDKFVPASRRYGEHHQRCPALNHMCNQSKLTSRRQVRVTSWPGCLKARDVQLAPAFCHSAKLSVCVSRMCSVSLLLSKIGNKKVCSNNLRRAKVVHSTDSVFLPAQALSRAGIHTVCAWSAWGEARRVGSWGGWLAALWAASTAYASLPENSLRGRSFC